MEDKFRFFAEKLRSILADHADQLVDCKLRLMEQEIADGWRCFYTQEVLLKEYLPLPLINELGRRYEEEKIRQEIWREPSQVESSYKSVFLEEFSTQRERFADYRNYLDVGILDTAITTAADPYDRTANSVVLQRLEAQNAHFKFEASALVDEWYIEATSRASLTPPLSVWDIEQPPLVRTADMPLVRDAAYWRAVHPVKQRIALVDGEYPAHTKPDWNLRLMAELAPDFPYSTALSTTKRLVFVQQGEGAFAWALMVDKTDGSPTYRYPPQLVLIDRRQTKKLKDEHILFKNVIGKRFISYTNGPRCMEAELLFHLPRSRRLIEFYAPFLEEAMRYASQSGQ